MRGTTCDEIQRSARLRPQDMMKYIGLEASELNYVKKVVGVQACELTDIG